MKTKKNYKFDTLTDKISNLEYKVSAGDILSVSISPNDGFNRINFLTEKNSNTINDHLDLIVDDKGYVKIPLIGLYYVEGKAIRELEKELESVFQNFYVKPFVTIKTSSKRFVVLKSEGASRSIKIEDENLTVFEAIAMSGGVQGDGKAYNIKLIRSYAGKTYVFKIDLSRIEGIAVGQKKVLPNDIIYIEPRLRLLSRALGEFTTVLSVITTTLLAINLFK